MFSPSRILGTISGLAVLACLLACGAMQQASLKQKRRNDLMQIGLAMHNYHDTKQSLPANEQDFLQWVQQAEPGVASIVQSGQYTIVYAKVTLPQVAAGDGTPNTVMAYENQPSPGGRLVLMADSSVQQMSEAEFNAKPKLKAAKK